MLAAAVIRTWVGLYTRGLPRELREARRQELASDLWEQQQLSAFVNETPLETAGEMFARTLLGMPADITWRVQSQFATRSDTSLKMNDSGMTRATLMACLVIVAQVPITATIIAVRNWPNDLSDVLFFPVYTVLPAVASIIIAFGLVTAPTKPGRGKALVAIGSGLVTVAWFWLFMITIPLGILLVTIAHVRGKPRGWQHGAGTIYLEVDR